MANSRIINENDLEVAGFDDVADEWSSERRILTDLNFDQKLAGRKISSGQFDNLSQAVADLPVGAYFTCEELGSLRAYRRTNTTPFYVDLGDNEVPLNQATFDTSLAARQISSGDFPARAAAVAALPVGTYFTSSETGETRKYLRVADGDGYVDQGDAAALVSISMLGSTAITVDRVGRTGAAADGAADDRSFFEALAAGSGTRLQLAAGRSYFVSAPVTWTRDIDLDLNGSTVVCPNGFLDVSNLKDSATAIGGLSIAEGDYTFTVPADLALAVGDLVRLESDDAFCLLPADNPYKYGQYSTIVEISDGIARMADPAVGSYVISRVYVFNPLKVGVRNGTLDMTASPDPAGASYPAIGIIAKAEDIRFEALRLSGGVNSGKGLIAEGRVVRARDVHAHGFLNVSGYGAGSSRWGYGMDLAGEDVIAEGCTGYECKHFIACGPRNFVTRNYRLIDCVGRNPKGDHTRTVALRDSSTELRYLAPFDAHGGVLNFVLDGVDIASPNNLISTRARNIHARRLRLTSYGVRAGNPNHYLIMHTEQVLEDASIQVDKLTWDPGISEGGNDASEADRHIYVLGISSTASGDHGDIALDLPRDGRVRWMEAQNNPDIHINSVSVNVGGGEWNGGLRLGGLGAVAIGSVGHINVAGRADFRTAGSVLAKSAIDAQCASLSSAKMRGDFDCNVADGPVYLVQLGNTTDAMVLPKVGDFRDCDATALLTAFAFFTASTTPAGKMMFDGSRIKYHAGGLAVAGQGINAVMGAAPSETWTFDGTAFDDTLTTQTNSQDIRILANSYVDLSGASLTKDPALGNSDVKVLPVRCRVKGASTLSLRQAGEASPYLIDYSGRIVRSATPTFTQLPEGTVIYHAMPASGSPSYWQRGAAAWLAGPMLA